jgi:hypothetical protein
MSRLIRGNLYDVSTDGMFHMVADDSQNLSWEKMSAVFHNNLDVDGKPYVGSLVVCRSSALGKADNTGIVTEAYSAKETKKMGSYGQLVKVVSPFVKNKQEISLLGNYDAIDFDDIEAYMTIYSSDYKKRLAFLENVSRTEKMKNEMVQSGKVHGYITRHADRILERTERAMPALSFADIDIGHSLD